MSRTADEGFKLYQELFEKNINLVFLKEHYIDTDTYRETLNNQLSMTGTEVDVILEGINKYLLLLAKKQIEIAFEQAEKEVQDLQQRTKEETQELAGISRNSLYLYKRELKEEYEQLESIDDLKNKYDKFISTMEKKNQK